MRAKQQFLVSKKTRNDIWFIACGKIFSPFLFFQRFVFILGQLLHGFGAAPLISLGTTFLDQSVLAKNSPMYIAIFQTWFIVGPAVGYIAGETQLEFRISY